MEADDGDTSETPVWFMERVYVQLKGTDSTAVIKEVSSDNTALVVLEDTSTKTVRVGEVALIPPKEHDMVLVTGGADVGIEGTSICATRSLLCVLYVLTSCSLQKANLCVLMGPTLS